LLKISNTWKTFLNKKNWSDIVNVNSSLYYDGDRLVTEIKNSDRLNFLYDESGLLYGFILNNSSKYFYVRDILQNILGIIDESGNLIVKYNYNAFFVVTAIIGAVVGFGLAAYNDYIEDGVWFNGSVGSYIGYTLGGAAIGAVVVLGTSALLEEFR
jgi:hypothetical protein